MAGHYTLKDVKLLYPAVSSHFYRKLLWVFASRIYTEDKGELFVVHP